MIDRKKRKGELVNYLKNRDIQPRRYGFIISGERYINSVELKAMIELRNLELEEVRL